MQHTTTSSFHTGPGTSIKLREKTPAHPSGHKQCTTVLPAKKRKMEIIDRRCLGQLHSCLHEAAAAAEGSTGWAFSFASTDTPSPLPQPVRWDEEKGLFWVRVCVRAKVFTACNASFLPNPFFFKAHNLFVLFFLDHSSSHLFPTPHWECSFQAATSAIKFCLACKAR